MSFTGSNSYKKLKKLSEDQVDLKNEFKNNLDRHSELSLKTEHLFFDYSRQLVNKEIIKELINLANEQGLKDKISAMFAGEKINQTEDRSVGHVDLRNLSSMKPEVKAVLDHIKEFSEKVLSGEHKGATGKKIKNIVSIGIGGSYLGPEYLATALRPYAQKDMNLVFVANVDGADFTEKTSKLNAAETLVIVVSKTFTTAETMKNAEIARDWIKAALSNHPDAIKKHFVAVSTAKDLVEKFGIDSENMFGFWNWVGGRYSATSAVGMLPLALYLGYENAKQILEGAHWMDKHFATEPFLKNIPILSAMLDIWNINFMGWQTRALLPYSQGLAKLPAHTQQVEMESNGKRVLIDGTPVDFATGEVVFGEPGTNGQHSFYQLIHQSPMVIPADFIGFINPQYPVGIASATEVTHHQELMTNFFAQPDALAFGKDDSNPHKQFPGNKPSSSLLLQELTPFTAGLLLAWTEHRAAVKGFIWGINSFDQFGVELGKVLGKDHRRRMLGFNASGKIDTDGLNPSTARMLEAFLRGMI